MECMNCNNCKTGQVTYYCPAQNDFVISKENAKVIEKVRSGWKKGDPEYELHRRRNRKEFE